MKRHWLIVAVLLVAIAALALVLRIVDSESDNATQDAEGVAQEADVYGGIVAEVSDDVCEVLVDFESVPYSSTTVKTIRVINRDTTPLVLVDYTTQCRCMWLDYSREPIMPGEYSDIELSFDSRGEWGSVGNYIKITTSCEAAPIVLWIAAEVE
ncbi:MAG: DUF1573 domain-containing protein [Alistipes sp.]|nr:DUF1573 domain-containing protein [Alistipes sp.]